jgi:hypothetical protein
VLGGEPLSRTQIVDRFGATMYGNRNCHVNTPSILAEEPKSHPRIANFAAVGPFPRTRGRLTIVNPLTHMNSAWTTLNKF